MTRSESPSMTRAAVVLLAAFLLTAGGCGKKSEQSPPEPGTVSGTEGRSAGRSADRNAQTPAGADSGPFSAMIGSRVPKDMPLISLDENGPFSLDPLDKGDWAVIFWDSDCEPCHELWEYVKSIADKRPLKVNVMEVDLTLEYDKVKHDYPWVQYSGATAYNLDNSYKEVTAFQQKYILNAVPTVWYVVDGVIYRAVRGVAKDTISDIF